MRSQTACATRESVRWLLLGLGSVTLVGGGVGGVLYFGGDGPAAEEASNERAADDLAALAAELPEATAPAEATEETGDEDAPALRLRRPALPGAWSEPETPAAVGEMNWTCSGHLM